MEVSKEKWYYLRNQAEKTKAQFLLCGGVVYNCRKAQYTTGNSPLWSIKELDVTKIPDFIPDPNYYLKDESK